MWPCVRFAYRRSLFSTGSQKVSHPCAAAEVSPQIASEHIPEQPQEPIRECFARINPASRWPRENQVGSQPFFLRVSRASRFVRQVRRTQTLQGEPNRATTSMLPKTARMSHTDGAEICCPGAIRGQSDGLRVCVSLSLRAERYVCDGKARAPQWAAHALQQEEISLQDLAFVPGRRLKSKA